MPHTLNADRHFLFGHPYIVAPGKAQIALPLTTRGRTVVWQILTNTAKPAILRSMENSSSITTLNVSLPEAMRKWIQAQVANGAYSSASEYVRSLIRADQKRVSEEHLDALLLEGLQSNSIEMTAKDWQDIRSQLRERLKKRRKK